MGSLPLRARASFERTNLQAVSACKVDVRAIVFSGRGRVPGEAAAGVLDDAGSNQPERGILMTVDNWIVAALIVVATIAGFWMDHRRKRRRK